VSKESTEKRITDELRACARTFLGVWVDGDSQTITFTTSDVPPTVDSVRMDSRLLAIADSIDKAHEEALREAYTAGRGDGMAMTNAKDAQAEYLRGKNDGYDEGYDAGFASADDWCAQHEDAMAEHGWYRALDADKAPIRIGDKVDSDHHEDGTVMGVQFYEMPRGIRTLVAVRPDGWDVATWHTPDEYHHHAPTVEGVLREMIAAYMDTPLDGSNDGEFFAKFAAKLRLVGDAE